LLGRVRLVVAFSLIVSACGPYARGVPLGSPVAPRPPRCPIDLEHLAPADAAAQWRQVGAVCLSTDPTLTPEQVYKDEECRTALGDQACRLGGEIVTPIGTCTNYRAPGIEFGVYVRR